MSGQTFSTRIRIPTPRELAAQAAEQAKQQDVAEGTGVTAIQPIANLPQPGLQALTVVLNATSRVTTRLPGTVRLIGDSSAEVEIAVGGARVPLRVDVDPDAKEKATVRLSFATAHGLSCADEARLMGEIATAMAAAGLEPLDPTGVGGVAESPAHNVDREMKR